VIGGAEVARSGVAFCGVGVSCGGAEAGMRGTVVDTLAGPVRVFWLCWWTTRVVKAPSRATALVAMISRYFFDCVQRKFILVPRLSLYGSRCR
jgi:hypothetical protein